MHVKQPNGELRQLWRFHGGIHPDDNKLQSTERAIVDTPLPEYLVLPLRQHIGQPPKLLVTPGDHVRKGQLLAEAEGVVSASLHAPSSGVVEAIEERPIAHPSGLPDRCIVLRCDGLDTWGELPEPMPDYKRLPAAELLQRIRWAGIVGFGGAGFPTEAKLNPGQQQIAHTLIVNGAECEPYISCDDMLMRSQAPQILSGIKILLHILGADHCLVGIEDNKPEAIQAMHQAARETGDRRIEIVRIPTQYPSGGEKQLIYVLTGREIPIGKLPISIGYVCQNVATVAAIREAVLEGRPVISRLVTISGKGVRQPGNQRALIGTPVADLIACAGGYSGRGDKLLAGGPMMGFALASDKVPVIKTSNCFLLPDECESPTPRDAQPCIRCGNCERACPIRLLPQELLRHCITRDHGKLQSYHIFDCIECGCCAHVCPSNIPLVQYYRFAKNQLWTKEKEKRKADHARDRHQARLERLERQERERKERHARQSQKLREKPTGAQGKTADRAEIAAAVERAKAKKTASGSVDDKAGEPPQ